MDASVPEVVDGAHEVVEAAAEAVELPDGDRVALPREAQECGELGSAVAGAGGVFDDDAVSRHSPAFDQLGDLTVGVLVAGGDSGVAPDDGRPILR